MHETFKRIIDDGVKRLERERVSVVAAAKDAAELVEKAKADMVALAHFASDLPTKLLDTFSTVMIGDIQIHHPSDYARLDFGGGYGGELRGMVGGAKEVGRYRAIVILQKID